MISQQDFYKQTLLSQCHRIANPCIKKFAEVAIEHLPDYFFSIAASSSRKYHPQYVLGEGGLVRHTIAAVLIASHLLQLEQYRKKFSKDEQDCIVVALLLHDGLKRGIFGSEYTLHEHPFLCAKWVKDGALFNGIVSKKIRRKIARCIAAHMGQWNTSKYSSYVLEKPRAEMQKFVHICDYLASRKDIEINFHKENVIRLLHDVTSEV